MTLSDQTRMTAVSAALVRMLKELGSLPIDAVRFEIVAPQFVDLPQTTWAELESSGWTRAMHMLGTPGYQFTGEGWIAALKAARQFDTAEQRELAVKLRAALKDVVKDRPLTGALTSVVELHGRTGLSADWIFNALSSRLLQRLWPTDHLDIRFEHGKKLVRVPARFGSRRLGGMEAGPFPDF